MRLKESFSCQKVNGNCFGMARFTRDVTAKEFGKKTFPLSLLGHHRLFVIKFLAKSLPSSKYTKMSFHSCLKTIKKSYDILSMTTAVKFLSNLYRNNTNQRLDSAFITVSSLRTDFCTSMSFSKHSFACLKFLR
jgi:hypothetical protein